MRYVGIYVVVDTAGGGREIWCCEEVKKSVCVCVCVVFNGYTDGGGGGTV